MGVRKSRGVASKWKRYQALLVSFCDFGDFVVAEDGAEFFAEGFSAGEAFAVGHEAGAHGHHGVAFVAVAVGVDGKAAVSENEGPAFLESGRGEKFAGFEVVLDFAEDPGVLYGGATDHGAVDGSGFLAVFEGFGGGDVAVSDDWDGDGLGALVDDIPVGFAAVGLGASSPVDGDGLDAAIFEKVADFGGVDGIGIPTDADFSGDGNLISDGLDDFCGGVGEEGAVAKEGGTAVFGDDFVDWAAEVEVDEVGLFPIDNFFCGFAHAGAIGSKELDSDGALFVGEGGVFSGALVGLDDAFGGDKLGDHDIGSEFLTESAESDVGDAGHGGEVEGESVLEPREHCAGEGEGGRRGGWEYLLDGVGLVVDAVAGLFESQGGGSDHAGFVSEASGEDLEMVFKGSAELVVEVGGEGTKKDGSGVGDSTADDDGFGIEKVAAVHDRAGEFGGKVIPDLQGDFVAFRSGFGELGWSAFFEGFFLSSFLVEFLAIGGDFAIAEIVFEGAEVSVGTFAA